MCSNAPLSRRVPTANGLPTSNMSGQPRAGSMWRPASISSPGAYRRLVAERNDDGVIHHRCPGDAIFYQSAAGTEGQLWVCAVTRRRSPVGAGPTRQPLQPEATGAAGEVTKWLKP